MAKSLIKILTQNEHIGILSVTTGQLDIVRIPVLDAPDWILPQALILSVEPYTERIWNYIWRNQDVSVYHLLPKNQAPDHIVIVESVTDVHRIALQIQGEVTYHSVRIADLKDADEQTYEQTLAHLYPQRLEQLKQQPETQATSQRQINQQHFVFQPVIFENEVCVIPDLDTLSHFLVDLDS